jgi:ribosome-binding ATPase YchF (GTP1/OBG family)
MPKSSMPQVKIVNVETGEEIIRDANAEELAQKEIDAASAITAKAEAEAKRLAEAEAKAALLARLGLTEDELKTILG